MQSAQIARILQVDAPAGAVEMEVDDRVPVTGGVRCRVRVRGSRGGWVPAFLFEPDAPTGSAVVIQHQHASRWHEGKSEVAGLVGEPLQAFGPALLAMGCTVLAPDAPGFEDRRATGPGTDERDQDWRGYYNAMAHRLVQGDLLISEAIGDLMRMVSVLASHPHVDPARLGFLGHSHGGNLGQVLTALDSRVRFACLSGCCGSLAHKVTQGIPLEFSLVVPGQLAHFDVPDLYRLMRPRPVLVVAGDEDPYAADPSAVLDRAGRWDALEVVITPGPHALDEARHRAILAWLDARCGSGGAC